VITQLSSALFAATNDSGDTTQDGLVQPSHGTQQQQQQELSCGVFVGGLPMVADEKALRRLVHVAVGTPGRLLALAEKGSLPCDRIALLVLDEADALLSDGFYGDVTAIYDLLPRRKQVWE
jgi:superfamily II DNA/RNA helicase